MDAIGGYFELADWEAGRSFPHTDGVLLNTGRNALEFILRNIGEVRGVYLPYYTCEVVLEPLLKLGIPWSFYHVNATFEIEDDIQLQDGEYLVANNYFGLKDTYMEILAARYGDRLIVDCSQAFFAKPILGIKTFYSARKFIGVADGGVAYIQKIRTSAYETECTVAHDSHLYIRKELGAESGFVEYKRNEAKLDNQPIRWMSDTTKRILAHIDYENIISKRRANYKYLHERLRERNYLQLPEMDSFVCPMVYPFLSSNGSLKEKLIAAKVYVATYWPNVMEWCKLEDLEYQLAESTVYLPIDQRYGEKEMTKILNVVYESGV